MAMPTEEIIQLKRLNIGLIELNRLQERKSEILATLDGKRQSIEECVYPPYNPPSAPSDVSRRKKQGLNLFLSLNQSKAEWAFFIAACTLVIAALAVLLFAILYSGDIDFFIQLAERWYLGVCAILLFVIIFVAIRLIAHKIGLSGKKSRGKLEGRYRKYIKVSFGSTLIEYDKKYNQECRQIKEGYDIMLAEYQALSQESQAELNRIEEKITALKKDIDACCLFSDRLKNLQDTKGILTVIENKQADCIKDAINIYLGYNG